MKVRANMLEGRSVVHAGDTAKEGYIENLLVPENERNSMVYVCWDDGTSGYYCLADLLFRECRNVKRSAQLRLF